MGTFLPWMKMMLRGDQDSATQYDLRGDAALLRTASGTPTMNFGYWRDVAVDAPDALWAATEATFRLTGETAGLGPADELVLDAGCGFGTNARYIVEQFDVQRVVGLNVSSYQLERCQGDAARAGLSARLDFRRGSATRMPFPDRTFDKVVSVEAAFHFPPRRRFFEEAFRVLKPGGTLALVDLVAPPPRSALSRAHLALLCRALQIPRDNVYGADEYRRQVRGAGLEVVEARSIREDVLPRYLRWLLRRPIGDLVGVGAGLLLSSGSFFLYPWDYICLAARRPVA